MNAVLFPYPQGLPWSFSIWTPTARDVYLLSSRPLFSFWRSKARRCIECSNFEEAEGLMAECSPPFLRSILIPDLNESD